MYYVYVLIDERGKYYKGCTNDLQRRLKEHNGGQTQTTCRMSGKLRVHYYEKYRDLREALARERYLKTAAGRRFLKNIKGP